MGRVYKYRRKRRLGYGQVKVAVLGLVAGGLLGTAGLQWTGSESDAVAFTCASPSITDGDTLRCGELRVRLHGIDAPELPGHCRQGRDCTPGDPYASTANLESLAGGRALQCRQVDTDAYGRTVARCEVNGRDLSCAQLDGGFAVRRYGLIFC